jgi:hypothetical protein
MVNIRIPGQKDFRCQAGQRAEDIVNAIRTSRLFEGGEIERNEFAMLANDLITEDGDYAFVNPVQAPQATKQGKRVDSLISSIACTDLLVANSIFSSLFASQFSK